MPNVIPFPARRGPMGEVIELAEVRAGLSRAASNGMSDADLQAVLNQDRPFATYALQLLGSEDAKDRRHGSMILARMTRRPGPPDEPPTAA